MTDTTTAAASGTAKHYAQRDHEAQGAYYINHVSAMTGEGLHAKSAIAAELAHRDIEIERLRSALAGMEPVAQVTVSDDDLDMGFSEPFINGEIKLSNGAHDLFTASQVQAMLAQRVVYGESPVQQTQDPDAAAFAAWCCEGDGITAAKKGGQHAE